MNMQSPSIGRPHPGGNRVLPGLLEVERLTCHYGPSRRRQNQADVVSDLSLAVAPGETLGLVGESGSGKSTFARALAGLHPSTSGTIRYRDQNIAGLAAQRSLAVRREIQLIFQDPGASLNVKHRVENLLARPLDLFFRVSRPEREKTVVALLEAVHLPADYRQRFPGEISGGERQRVAIARALAARPALLLCDEIVSALDVSVQASILELLRSIQRSAGLSILFITHDLAVVRWFASRVAVLYRGQLCEIAPVDRLFAAPSHPYTALLIEAAPRLGKRVSSAPVQSAATEPAGPTKGCAFAGRCAFADPNLCRNVPPPWRSSDEGQGVRCHFDLSHPLRVVAGGSSPHS